MKSKALFLMLAFFSVTSVRSQTTNTKIPLIGEDAPSFTAETTSGTLNFPEDYGRKWKVLLSHPADFTPVCSSEILEFAYAQKDFDKLGTQLVIVSTDDLSSHQSWKKSLESIHYLNRDPVKIDFPLVDDHTKAVATTYGMIHSGSGSTKDVRGVFIIDPNDKIRALFFYPPTTGRNVEEIERTISALQLSDKQAVVTPANWKPGNDAMVTHMKSGDELTNLQDPNYYKVEWYMWFKKAKQ
jgi:peroxiredoxin 2/4